MKESEITELKKSLAELTAGLSSISAILNNHGHGELWFGIRNDGKIVGLEVNEKTLRDVSQAIAAHIEPKIYPHVTLEKIEGCSCIKVVFDGHEAPYHSYGRAYMRVADEDRKLSVKALEKLILAKNSEQMRWDNRISEMSVADLDVEKLNRVDVPEVSVDALREAIINAFCHRDYCDPDYVQVAIFKDRVEIRNPGTLYGCLTLDDLRKGHVSQRRNPLIAELFRRIEMVEAWGRGMPLILKNAPDVVFREIGSLFIVSFSRPSSIEALKMIEVSGSRKKVPKGKFR